MGLVVLSAIALSIYPARSCIFADSNSSQDERTSLSNSSSVTNILCEQSDTIIRLYRPGILLGTDPKIFTILFSFSIFHFPAWIQHLRLAQSRCQPRSHLRDRLQRAPCANSSLGSLFCDRPCLGAVPSCLHSQPSCRLSTSLRTPSYSLLFSRHTHNLSSTSKSSTRFIS